MEVPQRRGHQLRAENGPSYQTPPSKDRSDGGMSKQDLLQRLRANKNRHNDQLVSRTTRPSEMQPNGPIPTGRQQSSLSPSGGPQRSLSPTGRQQSGSSPSSWRPQSGTSPTGRPPVSSGFSPSGRPPSGTSPTGRSQSGTSPPRRLVSDTSPTGRPNPGTNPTERLHNGQAPNFVRVEVEVHAKMTPEQTSERREIIRRRRRSTQPQSGIDSNIPEQQSNGPVAPPRRRYSTDSVTKDDSSPDSRQQDIKKEESIPKPMPRPRRSQSQDRGIAQQKRSDAEKQFLLKQYELLQKQKQQQIEKERQQRSTRDMQKVKVQQELQLLSEQEQRVVHKLQKFENGASTNHNVNWVRKQQQMFDRQHDVKIQRSRKDQHLEATNATVPNVQQLQQQAQHPQPAQRQRRRRPQPESKPQEQQQSTQQTKYKPPPVMPKPKSPELMVQSVTRQKPNNQNQYYNVQQQQLHQQSEKMRLQQERLRHQYHQSKKESSAAQLQVSEHQDQRGRRSSSRNSEASNQSHSSSDSSEVRLLHYKRRDSLGDFEPSKEHTKPQIKNPVARLSQALRKGTSSPSPQKQNENNIANNLRSVLEQTKPASSKREGISSQEMEEIIRRTAERMKREQQQMREAETRLNSSPERPRRRRRESQGIGESKMQQTTMGNKNRVTNIKAGSSSLDVYNAPHTDVTKPRDQGLHRVNDRKDNLVAEPKTSIQINGGPEMGSGVRSGTDESDGMGEVAMVEKIPHVKPDHDIKTRGKLGVSEELDNDPKLISEDEKIRKLSAIEEESSSRSESRQNSIGGAVISLEVNAIQSDSEDKALDEALGLLHELASTQVTTDTKSLEFSNNVSQVNVKSNESKSCENKYPDKRPTSPIGVTESACLETQSKKSENKSPVNRASSSTPQGIETRSLENKLTAHNNESTDGQASSFHGKPISDSVKVSPERALATSLPDSVIRNVSGEDTRADKAQTEETVLGRNKQREEIQPISNATSGTIEKRHEDLSRTVTPIPEVIQGEPGEDGIALRRKRFVKQVSFHSESEKLQQVIGEADKESSPPEKSQIETSPDSPRRGILARGRFSGKRDHPSLSKQTGEMYRRPKSAIFDVAIRKQPESKEKNDGGRQRPMSALYISEGDSDPMDRGRPLPKHYRPQSDSLMQLDKFDSLQIKPKARRDRSPSPLVVSSDTVSDGLDVGCCESNM
ncbi:putative mediator of RNA polymerase II transcription subunit 26 [Lytechinus variegatus]|uniref:putative mediator of RNA polymerase II transcription subunit 26 n=1 Tax=Lytechinus variegatus TaxID=7654 RepID=UPI001BB2C1E3|nr:putative mediator of RNA polymerase II transcription subunit 26 [Lytechinus variegatus]XP_041454926.1 putative mediator of RNA polymerase II transcription subunit 26 [Lytechinus variegatus]XP_041454928.1 putative mediator of RNA polymerase II transcription subunit 26 [Lytechinus variegatus]